jgi:hypothetical protein
VREAEEAVAFDGFLQDVEYLFSTGLAFAVCDGASADPTARS